MNLECFDPILKNAYDVRFFMLLSTKKELKKLNFENGGLNILNIRRKIKDEKIKLFVLYEKLNNFHHINSQ